MRRALRQLINVLDGKPNAAKGQSLVESALTFPILLLMVLGLAELGFAMNYYLTMLDLVREAGRRGANLSPVFWDDNDTRNYNRLDCDTEPTTFNIISNQNRRRPRGPSDAYGYTTGPEGEFGFFDGIACQIITSMPPMEFEDLRPWEGSGDAPPSNPNRSAEFTKNDIVVSAFSYVTMDFSRPEYSIGQIGSRVPSNRLYVRITGRYPRDNRYCVTANGSGDERDPFDYKTPDLYLTWRNGRPADLDELGYGIPTDDPRYNRARENITTQSQGIRGFVFTGNSIGTANSSNASDYCIGSRFTVQEVEDRLNASLSAQGLERYRPSGGLVLVEMFWQYHPRFFQPIVALFGGSGFFAGADGSLENDPVFHVFAFFPAPGAQATATPER
ncbi:MAG: pilus assembly protein [Anaerolineae bacterium]|nr:pilus assembly protein [Anaerolineae bacterium]